MAENAMELISSLDARDASAASLFGGEGRQVRNRHSESELMEVMNFVSDVESGKRPMYHLQEAMGTDDFPTLFADILDRQLLGYYQEIPPVWQAFARRSTVPDFRNVKRMAVDGAEKALSKVAELEEYPERELVEKVDEFSVAKYGARIDLSWEALVNDDLDVFRRNPERLARAARRTEQRFVTALYVDEKGPHASLYKEEWGNLIENAEGKEPALSLESLQLALSTLSEMTDVDGEPISVDMTTLVIPPALSVIAENILNAIQLELTTAGGAEKEKLIAKNWMAGRFNLVVDPYIPYFASKENGSTSWFLFANPNTSRPALEVGFLRGYEQPGLFERLPNSRSVGGGQGATENFDDDSRAWKVRHVIGGTRLTTTYGYKATVASNGSGK